MSTRISPGIGYILRDPDTKEILHRLEVRRDDRHGGKSGTMCWSIQNHVNHIEISFCIVYHEAFYDGLSSTPSHEGVNNIVLNTHFRELKEGSNSTDTWKHIAVQVLCSY